MIAIQIIWGLLLNAVVMGVVFARISHPKQRGRCVGPGASVSVRCKHQQATAEGSACWLLVSGIQAYLDIS